MSTTAESVLAAVAALAAEHHWPRVRAFTDKLPGPSDPGILLLGDPSAEFDAFTRWLRTTGVALTMHRLDDDVVDLTANRVLVAVPCGRPARLTGLFAHHGKASLVLVGIGAEQIHTDEDLAVADRWAARLLTDDDQVRLDHDCLLWTAQSTTSPRLEQDRDRLRDWLFGPVASDRTLLAARAGHALRLAEDAADAAETDPPATVRTRADAIAEAKRGRERASREVTGGGERLRQRITGSLRMFETDLRSGLAVKLRRAGSWPGKPAEDTENWIQRRAAGWVERETVAVRERTDDLARQLHSVVEDIGWAPIERVVGADRRRQLRSALIEAAEPAIALPAPENRSGPGMRGSVGQLFVPTAFAGAATVALALLFGAGAIFAVAAGIAGAVGFTAVHGVIGRERVARESDEVAAAIAAEIAGRLRESSLAVTGAAIQDTGRSLDAAFDRLDAALAEPVAVAAPDAVRDRLTELWCELAPTLF